MNEKRHFVRVTFHNKVKVDFGNKSISGELENISLNGALITFDQPCSLTPSDLATLHLALSEYEHTLQMSAVLAHHEQNSYGFKFKEMDINTMSDLRRLLELNTGDETEIVHELEFLVNQ